jgi:hypothetical protein
MDIRGLTLNEISEKINKYFPIFVGDDFKFQESYQLEFVEISHNIIR